MLIRVFKSNFPGLISGLFLILAILWVDSFILARESLPTFNDKAYLYQLMQSMLENFPYINHSVAMVLLFTNALLLNKMVSEFDLLKQRTYLPSLIYITFMSSNNLLLAFNPAIISGFFLLIMLRRIYITYNKPDDLAEVLNIGLLAGLGSLFYQPAIAYLLFAWIALIVFQTFSMRRMLITIIGFLTPYLFLSTFLFLTGKLNAEYAIDYVQIFTLPDFRGVDFSVPQYLLMGFYVLIVLASFFAGIAKLQEKIIRTRKMFTVFSWFFIVTIVSAAFSYNMLVSIAFAIIPLSLFIPNYFLQFKRGITPELWYLILVAIIIISKLNMFL